MPLSMVACGEKVRLSDVRAGGALSTRLSALGLTPGVELTVIQHGNGPMLVGVRDTRLALGRGEAQRIFVESIEGGMV